MSLNGLLQLLHSGTSPSHSGGLAQSCACDSALIALREDKEGEKSDEGEGFSIVPNGDFADEEDIQAMRSRGEGWSYEMSDHKCAEGNDSRESTKENDTKGGNRSRKATWKRAGAGVSGDGLLQPPAVRL